jgi:hypothetical protein
MLKDLTSRVANAAAIDEAEARDAIGLVFNTAERQGTPLGERVLSDMPGLRALSVATGERAGFARGDIARLIEQTPGGRRHVTLTLFSRLHAQDLGHAQIAGLMSAIGEFLEDRFNASAATLLSELFADMDVEAEARSVAAA